MIGLEPDECFEKEDPDALELAEYGKRIVLRDKCHQLVSLDCLWGWF